MENLKDYQDFMASQEIYLKEMPTETIDPEKRNIDWSCSPAFGDIVLKANINGPIAPELYFAQKDRFGVILKESFIREENWNDTDSPDRGGHNQSLELRKLRYVDIKDDDSETMYQNLVKFAFYLVNFIEQGVNINISFEGNEEVGMDIFKKHFAIQNACWFPHVGNKTKSMSTIIDWMIKYEDEHAQINKIFNPTLVLGTGTIKPQFDNNSNEYHALGLTREKIISREKIHEIVGCYLSRAQDDTFIMSDGKLYINIYHPSASDFSAKEIARGVTILYKLHSDGKL